MLYAALRPAAGDLERHNVRGVLEHGNGLRQATAPQRLAVDGQQPVPDVKGARLLRQAT